MQILTIYDIFEDFIGDLEHINRMLYGRDSDPAPDAENLKDRGDPAISNRPSGSEYERMCISVCTGFYIGSLIEKFRIFKS